jgi:tetratricopeptide (TPR) repeat protein
LLPIADAVFTENAYSGVKMADDTALSDEAREHYALGQRLVAAGSYPRAQEHFVKAIRICPDVVSLHMALGKAFLFQKKPDLPKALRAFLRAVDLNPDRAEGYHWLGMAQEQKGELFDAVASFERAIHLAADDTRSLISLGGCLNRLGKFDAAIQKLRRAIESKPRYGEASARLFLADALRRSGNTEAACDEWKLILEMPWEYLEYDQAGNEAKQLLKKYQAPKSAKG